MSCLSHEGPDIHTDQSQMLDVLCAHLVRWRICWACFPSFGKMTSLRDGCLFGLKCTPLYAPLASDRGQFLRRLTFAVCNPSGFTPPREKIQQFPVAPEVPPVVFFGEALADDEVPAAGRWSGSVGAWNDFRGQGWLEWSLRQREDCRRERDTVLRTKTKERMGTGRNQHSHWGDSVRK